MKFIYTTRTAPSQTGRRQSARTDVGSKETDENATIEARRRRYDEGTATKKSGGNAGAYQTYRGGQEGSC